MTKKQTTTVKQTGGPNTILVIIVAALVVLAIWTTRDKGSNEKPGHSPVQTAESSSEKKPDKGLTRAVESLGKVVAIGKRATALHPKGTTILTTDKVPGLEEALNGRDVDKVAALVEKAGIRHLIVDPEPATRNPIPENTVKNRLALARPAGRLSATMMSKELFLYELGEPPLKIPEKIERALSLIVRSAFVDREITFSGNKPTLPSPDGEWTMILTLRPEEGHHLSFHTTTQKTLVDAAETLGKKARKYYMSKHSFVDKYGSPEVAARDYLTFELEVLYDQGTFVGPRDNLFLWRIVEPGINGVRLDIGKKRHYLPPWYSVANNYRTITSLFNMFFVKKARQKKDYWKRDDVSFDRFRTVHWRETKAGGGPIEELYRFSPTLPTTADVTRENMVKTLKGLGDWISDNQTKSDGSYVYRYYPTKDTESDEYNMVRHCLGPFSLALAQEYAPNPDYKKKAEAGMRFIEKHIRWGGPPRQQDGTIDTSLKTWMGKPLPGKDVAIIDYPEPPRGDWSAKMGGVAVSILGYTQYKRAGWILGPKREKVLEGLANFLLYMQDEEKGSFHHYYVAPKNHYYRTRNSIYPGEILYAVARLYGETKDERYKAAFKKSMDANLKWFKEQMAMRLPDGTYEETQRKNLVQFQPWIAMAMDEMYRYDPDPAYVEASNLVSLWILDTYQFNENRAFFPDYLGGYMKVLDELPAMHTFVYTEGVAASYDLAKRTGADPKTVDKLRKGALLAARFIMQQQVRPGENDFYYPNPEKAKGGVRYCMNHNKQRIDYTYHALSSIYRIIKAATDEDYAEIQKIPMPKKW